VTIDDFPRQLVSTRRFTLGVPREVTGAAEIARLERIGLEPYAPNGKNHWMRITARTVSGRRVQRG
jgi:hypothetical protein